MKEKGKVDYISGIFSMMLFLAAFAVVADVEVFKWFQILTYGFLGFIFLWTSVEEIL